VDLRIAAIASLAAVLYLALSARLKAVVCLFVMTNCFDLLPQIIDGIQVWDVGAIMLLVLWIQLVVTTRWRPAPRSGYVMALRLFYGWLLVCLAWSLLVERHPALNTLKTSRQMLVGYLSLPVFLRLFAADEKAFGTVTRTVYLVLWLLLSVYVAQFFLGRKLLFGLAGNYGDALRAIPSFLPIGMFYMWRTAANLLAGGKTPWHEKIYFGLVLMVIAFTFTRGIYLVALLGFGLLLIAMMSRGTIQGKSVIGFGALAVVLVVGLGSTGAGQLVLRRFSSGVGLVTSQAGKTTEVDPDTYTGRIGLLRERMQLVWEVNPLVGFAFLHQEDVPRSVQARLHYGTAASDEDTDARAVRTHYGMYDLRTPDIGWADIVVDSGYVGCALFLWFVVMLFRVELPRRGSPWMPITAWRVASYIQTVAVAVLMAESDGFVRNVQIVCFILACGLHCAELARRSELVDESGARPASIRSIGFRPANLLDCRAAA